MPQTRPEYRKSKWEKQTEGLSQVQLNKPLVEYDNFSSSDDEQVKEPYPSETRRRVVLKSVNSEKIKTRDMSAAKADSQKARKSESHKSHKSDSQKSHKRASSDSKEAYHSQRRDLKEEKRHKKHNKNKSKIESSKSTDTKIKSSVKKLPRKRSRSRSLSFTESDFSNDNMDRHMPLSHGTYDRRQFAHSPVKDPYVNHREFQAHPQQQPRYGRGRSPVAPNYAAAPRVPIRRSITPPAHKYSPRRKEPQFANHDPAQQYHTHSRSPAYTHPSTYPANQG